MPASHRSVIARSSRDAFSIVEMMVVILILAILATIAVPAAEHLLSQSQTSVSQDLLLHLNEEAFSLAAANGDGSPTYGDFTSAAGSVYAPTGSTAISVSVTASSSTASTAFGSVNVTVVGSGTGEIIGLAMVNEYGTGSVYLQATGAPGAQPSIWHCSVTPASAQTAVSAVGTC